MVSVRRLLGCSALGLVLACSPEAARTRDGGRGADPGNYDPGRPSAADPQAADTTLWPGRAPTPVERLARGEMPPPAGVTAVSRPPRQPEKPITPDVPATASEQRTFDEATSANPRRPSRAPR